MEKPIRTTRRDIPTLLREAQNLVVEAAATSGEKAVELRQRAQELMHEAAEKAAALKTSGKEAMHSADEAIHAHPYKAIAVAAGVGVVVGLLLARKP